jgi:hypothetical protein
LLRSITSERERSKVKRFAALLLAAGLVGACATPGTSSTTLEVDDAVTTVPTAVAEVTTTQTSPTTTTASTTTVASTTTAATAVFADIPQVCVDAIQTYLIAIEEPLGVYDFETSGWYDYVELQLAMVAAQEPLADVLQAPACAEAAGLLNPENSTALLGWAETAAPGSVAFLEVSRDLNDMSIVDCETSIGDLQAYVDRGGSVADISTVERWHAFNLVAYILTWCDLAIGHRFVSQAVVEDFIGANLVG